MVLRQFCVLFIGVINFVTSSFVTLNPSGGYENIVVAISPEIDGSKVESLLFRLEALFEEASKVLQTSTRGRFYFQEVIFALPEGLLPSLSKRDFQEGRRYLSDPDAFVEQDALFENPYTVQHGGCGQRGLKIVIPQSFLFDSGRHKARAVVREWAHYRYGVFDESGFPGDPLYPPGHVTPGSGRPARVTDCTNEDAVYQFRDTSGLPCDVDETNCSAVPDELLNDRIVSSLMTKLDFSKVEQFCDDESFRHNRNSPTKQNALCREKSVWEVISGSPDFRLRRSGGDSSVVKRPTFRYIVESEPRFILAVDTSQSMALNDRFDAVRNGFAYFAFEELPATGLSGIVDMGRPDADAPCFPVRTPDDAETLVDAFPDGGAESVCVHCGILKGIQALHLDSNQPISSGTLLVATSTDIADHWSTNITDILVSNDVTLHVIYFRDKSKRVVQPNLETLAISTGGKFFYIPEGATDLSPLSVVYEAFRAVYQSFSWTLRNHVLVDQRTFPTDSMRHSMSFTVDDSVDRLRVLVTGPGFISGPLAGFSGPLVKGRTLLRVGGEVYGAGKKSYAYRMKIPAYMFSIDDPQEGTWNLTFERKAGFKRPLTVIIRASNRDQRQMINVQAFASDSFRRLNSTRNVPHRLHAVVSKGLQPIATARVTAHVLHFETGRKIEIELRDNGNGDPDVTGSDGIYSRYLTGVLSNGYYLLTVVVEIEQEENGQGISTGTHGRKHCCGSALPPEVSLRPGRFKRVVTSGAFLVSEQDLPGPDPAPGRIADLRVSEVRTREHNVRHFTLAWTAPGSDYDSGNVTFYELKVFGSRDDALYRFSGSELLTIDKWRLHGGNWLFPLPSGSNQNVIVELRNMSEGDYFLAMRAVDSAANVGPVSNVIEVHVPVTSLPTTLTTGATSVSEGGTSDSSTYSSTSAGVESSGGLGPQVTLAIGLTCGLLILLLLVGFLLMALLGRHRKNKKNRSKTESIATLCRSTVGVSVITPVSSWPAGSLLAHYEKNRTSQGDLVDDQSTSSKYSYVHKNPEADLVDGQSMTSTKFSYVNQNSSLYDSIYFNAEGDELNYPFNPSYAPFNPSYTPFNPTYTSSLRRDGHQEPLSASVRSYDYYSSLNGRRPPRLKTDV